MRLTEDRVREIVTELLDGFTFQTDSQALSTLDTRIDILRSIFAQECERLEKRVDFLHNQISGLMPAGLVEAEKQIANLEETISHDKHTSTDGSDLYEVDGIHFEEGD